MNATKRQNLIKPLVMIGLLLFCLVIVPLGLAGFVPLPQFTYVTPAILAVIAFCFAIILSIRRKRISIDVVFLLVIGLFFLASSVVAFGYSKFTENMPVHDQIEFSRLMRPNQVSRGLAEIGMGIGIVFVNIVSIKMLVGKERGFQFQRNKVIGSFVTLCLGIFFVVSGFYNLITGLQPLS